MEVCIADFSSQLPQTLSLRDNELVAPDNPHSIPNLLQGNATVFVGHLYAAYSSEYAHLTEEKFKEHFGHDKNFKIMRLLRYAFWNEYELACRQDRKINLANVWSGICAQATFNKHFEEPLYAAYITSRPAKLSVIQQDLIYLAYEQMETILAMKHIDSKGVPDTRLIREKLNILKNLEDRHSGGVIEKKQIHQITENVTGKPEDNLKGQAQYDKLKEEIAALKEKLGQDALSDIIDVPYKEV